MADKPNPERVYAALAGIPGRRYDVVIEYTLHPKGEQHEEAGPSGEETSDSGKSRVAHHQQKQGGSE